jgi:hypothetical protein
MNIIDTLVFEGFSIKLTDFIEERTDEGTMYTTDASISSEEFNSFIKFYRKHQEPGKYFNTILDSRGFYGRFGQLLYSKEETQYLIRLVFVESKIDINMDKQKSLVDVMVTKDARYLNLVNVVSEQKVIINQLKSLLESKGLLTAEEIDEVFNISEDKIKDVKFEMATKVKDLNKYLKEQKDTLSDIRNDQE